MSDKTMGAIIYDYIEPRSDCISCQHDAELELSRPHQWRRSMGSFHGISFGAGWVGLSDASDCSYYG